MHNIRHLSGFYLEILTGHTSLCHVELDSGWHGVAGAAGVVSLVPGPGVTEGQLALGGLVGGGVGLHLDPPLHVVVDHPVVVVPEDVLGRAGGGVQDAGQRDRRPLVHVVLLSPLDVGLGVHHLDLDPPGDGPRGRGYLTLVDAAVSVLNKLYLQEDRVSEVRACVWWRRGQLLTHLHYIHLPALQWLSVWRWLTDLQYPVEGSLSVENIEPVVSGEPHQAIGQDVPVSYSHPGDLR